MKQTSQAQQKIIDAMKEGRKLSSLLATTQSFGMQPLNDFGVRLEGQHKGPSILTVKAMLKHGFIQESKRWQVGDDLWHIEYQVADVKCSHDPTRDRD